MNGNMTLQDQIEQLNLDLTASKAKTSKIGAGTEEEVDLERDENQESLLRRSELDPNSNLGERNKKFLLNELKQLKDQMYGKLMFFKSRTQGKKGSKRLKESEQN